MVALEEEHRHNTIVTKQKYEVQNQDTLEGVDWPK